MSNGERIFFTFAAIMIVVFIINGLMAWAAREAYDQGVMDGASSAGKQVCEHKLLMPPVIGG